MSSPFDRDWNKEPSVPQQPKPYTDITVVFDRSASMVSLQNAVVEGFNEYVGKLRETPGDNKWSMVHFDDHDSARGADESFPLVVFDQVQERDVPLLQLGHSHLRQRGLDNAAYWGITPPNTDPIPPCSGAPARDFVPRGSTALVDALCKTIDRTELRTSGMEHVKVMIGIFTDGQENSSREYTSQQLRERIARTQSKKGWDYLYFGANQDAFAEAGRVGIGNYVSSGHLAKGSSYSNNFVATNAGMYEAIGSGMVGMFHIASGSMASGRLVGSGEIQSGQISVRPTVVVSAKGCD